MRGKEERRTKVGRVQIRTADANECHAAVDPIAGEVALGTSSAIARPWADGPDTLRIGLIYPVVEFD